MLYETKTSTTRSSSSVLYTLYIDYMYIIFRKKKINKTTTQITYAELKLEKNLPKAVIDLGLIFYTFLLYT